MLCGYNKCFELKLKEENLKPNTNDEEAGLLDSFLLMNCFYQSMLRFHCLFSCLSLSLSLATSFFRLYLSLLNKSSTH